MFLTIDSYKVILSYFLLLFKYFFVSTMLLEQKSTIVFWSKNPFTRIG